MSVTTERRPTCWHWGQYGAVSLPSFLWHHRSVTKSTGGNNFAVSVIWPDVDDQPVLRANQFLGQMSPDASGAPEEFILTIGYISPPVMLGSPEEQAATMAALGAVSVRTLTRVSMSRSRLGELLQLLQAAVSQYDAKPGGGQG
jgi:hypothetical protein